MKRKIFILDDNPRHLRWMIEGVKMSKYNHRIEIITYTKQELDKLIIDIEGHNALASLPEDIDIFIIDACLVEGKVDEYGLKLLKELKDKYPIKSKFIVTTQWDPSEFKTDVKFDYFVNKKIYIGFELKYRFRDIINKVFEEI